MSCFKLNLQWIRNSWDATLKKTEELICSPTAKDDSRFWKYSHWEPTNPLSSRKVFARAFVYLDTWLGEVDLQRDFFSHEDVGISRLAEKGFKNVELSARECRPFSSLFSGRQALIIKNKKKIVDSHFRKTINFSQNLISPCFPKKAFLKEQKREEGVTRKLQYRKGQTHCTWLRWPQWRS